MSPQYGLRPEEAGIPWSRVGGQNSATELFEKSFGDVAFYLEGDRAHGWRLTAKALSQNRDLGLLCSMPGSDMDLTFSTADDLVAYSVPGVRCAADLGLDLELGFRLSNSAILDYDRDRLREGYVSQGASPLLATIAEASAESAHGSLRFFDTAADFPAGTTQADLDGLRDEISELGLGHAFGGSFNLADDESIVVCYGGAWYETADALAARKAERSERGGANVKPSFEKRALNAGRAAEDAAKSSAPGTKERSQRAAMPER